MTSTPTAPTSAIHWFEIPVHDLDRAQRCWEQVLDRPMHRERMQADELALFAYEPGRGCGGCLIQGPGRQPGPTGTLIFLNAEPSLDAALARAAAAGLHIDTPRVELPPGMGAYAVIVDTEGNRVGLHVEA